MFSNHSYSFYTNQQTEIEPIPDDIKKIGNISFKRIVEMANSCIRAINTPFGQQLSINQGKMYKLLDVETLNMDIHGNYIVQPNQKDNCWIIIGTKE